MSDPLISICLPAYKADRHIGETLASIRAQIFTDWELVVVEDGSHDNTEEIVNAFARTVTQPVVFLRHDLNRGLPGTRNTAIKQSRGEWIALIDADDLWTPDHLERGLACARQNASDLVHTGVMLFDSETNRDLQIRAPSPEAIAGFPKTLFSRGYLIQPSSVIMRRELCLRIGGFDPNCRYVEDLELWLRLVRAGAKVSYCPSITCRYRQHLGAMTQHSESMAAGVAYVFERNSDWETIPRRLRRQRAAEAWLSAGRIVLRTKPRLAFTHIKRALRHQPWSPRLHFFWCAAAVLRLFTRAPHEYNR